MLSTLITSKSRVEIITWFVTHPGERFHYNQLIGILKASPPSIQNELKRLEKAGLLLSIKEANVRFYWANQDFVLYPEIKSIIYKTTGLADILKEKLKKYSNIEIAFIHGSVAKNTEDVRSDIDLMFIGNPDYEKLSDVVIKAEKKLSREISFTVTSSKEWKQKLKSKGFAYQINKEPKIFLISNKDELRKIS